jgi:glycerol-1-phosphate dehydrogenase [NAD(P)+]
MAELFDSLGLPADSAGRRGELPRAWFYEPQSPARLAHAMLQETRGRRALVLCDTRTRAAAGPSLLQELASAGWSCTEVVLPDVGGRSPVCDDLTHDRLRASLPQADAYFALGSGVINDLVKWLAADAGVVYGVMATAATMNGYSAANVAPTIAGVKSLMRARAPRVIGAVPVVIEAAPWHLTAAGLGDVIAKPVSTADWWMNHRIFGEDFSRQVADLIHGQEPRYLDHPEALARREPGAIRALFEALLWSGCAMTLQGSSLPASGGEHLISHTLDMFAQRDGTEHDLHGRQVGVATIFVAAMYARLLALAHPQFTHRTAPFEAAAWGSTATAVKAEHEAKQQRAQRAARWLDGSWETLRPELGAMLRSPGSIKEALARSCAAHRISDIGCSRDRFLQAVLHCGAMRARFTSIDLGWCAGLLPEAASELMDEWLV